jgi:hypothetical protein
LLFSASSSFSRLRSATVVPSRRTWPSTENRWRD